MKILFCLMMTCLITACSSGSSGSNDASDIRSGIFKDSNVVGLNYSSGQQEGQTDAGGGFQYEAGSMVTFSVGGVSLGATTGQSVLTPLDLVNNGTSSSMEVINIVRFLLLLDDDADGSNGINIPSTLNTVSIAWPQVDFSSADLDSQLTSIISDITSVTGSAPVLPTAMAAQNHIEGTLRCVYSGAYVGSFSGGDTGRFGLAISAATGSVSGAAYSTAESEFVELMGTAPISLDQSRTFTSGNVTSGATFEGGLVSANRVVGTWNNSIFMVSGTYSGDRIGGADAAVFRFTGVFTGDDDGLFSFDVDESNNVTGVAYDVVAGESLTLSGSVTGTMLSATLSNGATISGTLNTSTGALSGTWNNASEGASGTYTGDGCQLN